MKTSRAVLACALLATAALWFAAAARAADVHVALVAISGTVSGAPESVLFAGQAKIESRLAPDPDFNRPTLVVTIDLTEVPGVGTATLKKYVVSAPEVVQRRAATSHTVEVAFPFAAENSPTEPRTGKATFALTFDLVTGAVSIGSAAIDSPSF